MPEANKTGRLITELGSRLNLAPEKCQKLSAQLEAVKTHIKCNLVHHLKDHSPCPSHCFHFLMSNPNLPSQASECPSTCGQHQQHCVECDLQHVFFNSLEALIHGGEQSGQLTSDTLKDLKALVRWRGGVLLCAKPYVNKPVWGHLPCSEICSKLICRSPNASLGFLST